MHYAMSLIVFICVLTPLFSVNSGLFTISNTTSTHKLLKYRTKLHHISTSFVV